MKLNKGDLISIITLRDGLGRPRFWKTAEVIGFENGKVVASFYNSCKDAERTIKTVSTIDIEAFTSKDLAIQTKGYKSFMEQFGKHNNETWKILEETGRV